MPEPPLFLSSSFSMVRSLCVRMIARKPKSVREGKLWSVVVWGEYVVSVVVVFCRVSPNGVGLRSRMKNHLASIGQNGRKNIAETAER